MAFEAICVKCGHGRRLRQWQSLNRKNCDVWSCLDCGKAYVIDDTGSMMETQGSKCGRPSWLSPADRIAAYKSKNWETIERLVKQRETHEE